MFRIIIAVMALAVIGCTPRPVAWPISSSHTSLTATEYDDAESHFSGGLAPVPDEFAAMECQRLLDKRDTASAVVLGLTGLGGAGGLAALLPKNTTPEEARRWELGLGISALAVGTTAVILGALTRSWSAQFEEKCGTKAAPVELPKEDSAL